MNDINRLENDSYFQVYPSLSFLCLSSEKLWHLTNKNIADMLSMLMLGIYGFMDVMHALVYLASWWEYFSYDGWKAYKSIHL